MWMAIALVGSIYLYWTIFMFFPKSNYIKPGVIVGVVMLVEIIVSAAFITDQFDHNGRALYLSIVVWLAAIILGLNSWERKIRARIAKFNSASKEERLSIINSASEFMTLDLLEYFLNTIGSEGLSREELKALEAQKYTATSYEESEKFDQIMESFSKKLNLK